ncbi:MAG: EVE domain-containing protein [Candidatus Marinimicrobia bacterium]|nr:EVE domain-containing protein [Candidatus Neomarinimicrobiota bacterium]
MIQFHLELVFINNSGTMSGWLIISSKQNFEITSKLGFTLQGLKMRHRKKALQIEPGDLLFYYITGEQKLAAMVTIQSFVFEGQDKIWVNLGKDPEERYPWRFEIKADIILEESDWIVMETFSKRLLHFRKWPENNWRLGLQGQIHALREEDTNTLKEALLEASQD